MDRKVSRREFVKGSAAAGMGLIFVSACVSARQRPTLPGPDAYSLVDPDSSFFATVRVKTFSSLDTDSRGDLWPSTTGVTDRYSGSRQGAVIRPLASVSLDDLYRDSRQPCYSALHCRAASM